ncbi:MAG TPA: hypothetical protein VKX16_05180 [Chloroflexota bacterium]|nr:hypothetical protein [Chloroflexota bacterium]
MKRVLVTGLMISILAGSTIAGAASSALAASPDSTTKCNGSLPPGTYGNVLVPKGATCTLTSGVVISGNLKALSGNTLSITSVSIGRNLVDTSGAALTQTGATIGGTESVIGLTSSPQGGTNTICASQIGKNLLVESLGSAAAVNVGDTTGPAACTTSNTVAKNGVINNNSAEVVDVSGNTFNDNLTVDNNSSLGLVVMNNTVGNQCEQHGNQPSAQFSGNTAHDNDGC